MDGGGQRASFFANGSQDIGDLGCLGIVVLALHSKRRRDGVHSELPEPYTKVAEEPLIEAPELPYEKPDPVA